MKILYLLVLVGLIVIGAFFASGYLSKAEAITPPSVQRNSSATSLPQPTYIPKNTTVTATTTSATTSNSSKNQSAIISPSPSKDDPVSIPLSEISTSARFYTFDSNGVTVRYFVVLGSDGKVRTAFDACRVCYKNHKGYTQVGNYMKCNNCGKTFSIDELGTGNSELGCWPSYLANEVKGDSVLLKKTDLEANAYLFG